MRHTTKVLIATLAIVLTALFARPATACEFTTYTVTASETTAVDLDIEYSDNLDFELDHPRECVVHTERAPLSGYVYAWYECTVPSVQAL